MKSGGWRREGWRKRRRRRTRGRRASPARLCGARGGCRGTSAGDRGGSGQREALCALAWLEWGAQRRRRELRSSLSPTRASPVLLRLPDLDPAAHHLREQAHRSQDELDRAQWTARRAEGEVGPESWPTEGHRARTHRAAGGLGRGTGRLEADVLLSSQAESGRRCRGQRIGKRRAPRGNDDDADGDSPSTSAELCKLSSTRSTHSYTCRPIRELPPKTMPTLSSSLDRPSLSAR